MVIRFSIKNVVCDSLAYGLDQGENNFPSQALNYKQKCKAKPNPN